jgi:DNA sulfur modification protein DndD
MLIRAISLHNFGLFQGRNRIDLTPRVKYRRERPVVLIGGRNGSGKTTILEALRLCLYGPLAFGERTARREYESYLRDRVHRRKSGFPSPHSASVGVEFEYSIGGQRKFYVVQRSWELKDRTVDCELSITCDGQPLDELDRAHADEFLRDLVPPGVSQLYFFDGEKIQELAESNDDSGTLGDAIRGLLGLDLVDQLIGDLKVYSRRQETSTEADPISKRIQETVEDIRIAEESRVTLVRSADQCQSAVDSIEQHVARLKQRIVKEGGSFATHEESLKAEREQLLRSVQDAEDVARELCSNLLPFAFCLKLCATLDEQLKSEERVQNWNTHRRILADRLDILKSQIHDDLFASPTKISTADRKRISERLKSLLDELLADPDDLPKNDLIHRLSVETGERFRGAIQHVREQTPAEIVGVQSVLEESTRRLRQISDQLVKLPAEDQLKPLLEELSAVHRKQIEKERVLSRRREAVEEEDVRIAALKRQEEKLLSELEKANSGLDRNQLVARVQSVLSEYSEELALAKSRELAESVARRFSELWQKQNVIQRIEIDPTTYHVTLYDEAGRAVSKRELSAGEKQIYAVAMLWSLTEVSGRPLPMVIDTPLGRLDSGHRTHLVEHYFPHASHQVIVLSTDTEIDEQYFTELSPAISHSYRLRYDEDEARTVVEEGYFWGRRIKEVAHAT